MKPLDILLILLISFPIFVIVCCKDDTPTIPPFTTVPFDTLPSCLQYEFGVVPYLITTQAAYDSIVKSRDSLCAPVIDFSKYSLLGQSANAGGCSMPDYRLYVTANDQIKQLVYRIQITIYGPCAPSYRMYKWVRIPKIPDGDSLQYVSPYDWIIYPKAANGYTVYFQREEIQLSEK